MSPAIKHKVGGVWVDGGGPTHAKTGGIWSPLEIIPSFAPTEITGLQLWLKADALSLADTAPVASWTDASSSGGHAVQATTTRQPIFKTNILNGKPVVRFDGVDDFLASPVSAATKPFTVFGVFKVTNPARSSPNSMLAATASGGFHWRIQQPSNQVLLKQAVAFIGTGTGTLDPATWYVLAATYSATGAWAIYQDGVLGGNGINSQTLVASTTHVGSQINSEFFGGDMAEVVKFDSVLSTADLNRVGSYLGTEYALTWTDVT